MNKSKFLVLLMMLVSMFKLCFAQGGNTFNGRVIFAKDTKGNLINPFTTYGNKITYYIPPGSQTLTLTINTITYTLNIAQFVREAANEWQIALQNRIIFESTNTAQPSRNINLLIGLDYQSANNSREIAVGLPTQLSNLGMANIRYFPNNIEAELSNPHAILVLRHYLGANTSVSEIINFLIRESTKHEMGHVLGLLHPNLLQPYGPLNESEIADSLAVIIPNYENPGIPIMTSDPIEYLQSLFDSLGRTVNIDDIAISAQEMAALDTIYQATQQRCSCCVVSYTQPNNWLTSSTSTNSNYSCPNFENNFIKVLQYLQISAVNHLYALGDGILQGIVQIIPIESASQNKVIIRPYYIAPPKEL